MLPIKRNHSWFMLTCDPDITGISLHKGLIGRLMYPTISRPNISLTVHNSHPISIHCMSLIWSITSYLQVSKVLESLMCQGIIMSANNSLLLSSFSYSDLQEHQTNTRSL